MANGVQLATAYISLNVRTDDIKKQVQSALDGAGKVGSSTGTSIARNIANSMRSHLGGVGTVMFAPMEIAGIRWAVKAGAAIGGMLKKAIMGAVGGLGLGAIFGAGGVLTAGLDRLKTLQQSTIQLSLKLKPEDIKTLQKQISDVVTGTPISLDKAMQAVPAAINAGLKGDQVKQYIKDIADLTASTGGQGQFDQLAVILGQIRSKGKLAGDEVQQLVDAGVDVRGILKDTFGWDDKTLEKNLTKGKVGINELQKAIQKTFGNTASGGLAKEMGKTFDGAIGSLKASAARLGANFIGAIFGKSANDDPLSGAADGITKITEKLNGMGKWVDAHREDIHTVFTRIGDAALWAGDKIGKISSIFNKVKTAGASAVDWLSSAWERVTSAVGRTTSAITNTFNTVKTKIGDVVGEIKKKFESIFGPDGWFAKQFDKLGKIVDKVREVLGLGEATANAATPGGPSDAAPFNPGPMAPGAFGPYKSRAGLAPGTPLDGSDQGLSAVPNGVPGLAPTAIPGGFNKSAVMGRVPAGRYVDAREFQTGDVNTLGDLTLGLGDCTSAIEDLVNIIDGKSTAGRSMYTGNADKWAAEHGFTATDKPMPGAFQIGFNDSHMQATLPTGDAFNWGSNSSAGQRGLDGGQGAWFDGATKHYYKQYGSGGNISGPGSGTSDSIPAMLSNGEHVLTASDVAKMGGQGSVYAFRQALQNNVIPGFAPGGAVDTTGAQDNVTDLTNAAQVAQAQFNETMNNTDASEADKLSAQQNLAQALRAAGQAQADLPTILAGGTPPDRSAQNDVFNLTDQLAMAQQRQSDLQASGNDIPVSQQMQNQFQMEALQRDRNQAVGTLTGQGGENNYGLDFVRSLGFIPASAGNTGVAGTSSLAGFINMGNSVVSGVIDTGTNLAQMAATAAIAAGTMGAGSAAGPAASMATSYGIQLAGNEAKRISSYWFQMAGIGADALVEQLTPFGTPRYLGYDYGQFAPQLGVQEAFSSTLEKAGGDAIKGAFGANGQAPIVPSDPTAPTNTAPSGPAAGSMSMSIGAPAQQHATTGAAPNTDTSGSFNIDPLNPLDPNGAGGSGGGGSWARGGAIGIYDNGGVLNPGQLAMNASRTPESILTKQQWNAMMSNASTTSQRDAPLVGNLYAQDMQDAIRQLDKVKRRDMMQYAGRS